MKSFALLTLLLLVPAVSSAQEQTDVERARALFEQGIADGEAGNWEAAVEHFRESRAIADRPSTIYNLAIAYQELGRYDEASSTLDEYFAVAPEDDSRRLQAEGLRARLAARTSQPTGEQPTGETPSPTPPPQRGADPTPWVLVGVGAAVAVAGVVLAIVGQLDYDSVSGAPADARWADYQDAWNRAPILVGVGWASIGVGVAVAAVGLVLATTSGGGERASARLEVTPTGLALRGRF